MHAEDIEHFRHHEEIERKEAEKEAKYQGISVDEALAQHDPDQQPPPPKVNRVPPPEKQDPAVRFANAKGEADRLGEWGAGDEGYKPPVNPSEKMRKNLPYKVRWRVWLGVGVRIRRLICSSSTSSVAAGAISKGLGKSLALDAAACSMARRYDDDDGDVLGILRIR